MLVPIRSPSSATPRSGAGRLPVARITCLAVRDRPPSSCVDHDLARPAQPARPRMRATPFCLKSASMPRASVSTIFSLRRSMAAKSQSDVADDNPVLGPSACAVRVYFRSTRAAPCWECSPRGGTFRQVGRVRRCRPRTCPAVLREWPPRSPPDHHRSPPDRSFSSQQGSRHDVLSPTHPCQTSSSSRAGSSMISLILRRNVTASRPSTMR